LVTSGWVRRNREHTGANNVNLLAYTAILNWMALHETGLFTSKFPGAGLPPSLLDSLTAFEPIVQGKIT
jgi:hypothetical protein